MVTSHDVAKAAGVSQSTVSRVLNNSPKVDPETRTRVMRALAETGYAPNAMARAMRTRRIGTIGVVVSRITNPFYPELVRLLSRSLDELQLRMTLWDAEGPGEFSAVEAIRQGTVDGVIFTTATRDSTALREALHRNSPVVLVNRTVQGLRCDQVTSENHRAGYLVADYLLSAGHRQIGLVAGPPEASTASEREAGFRDRLAESEIELSSELVRVGNFSHEHGHESIRTWFRGNPQPPTAVFCVNDLIALGALDGARAQGVRIPEDLWIVGHDDIEMASWEAFDLTTVRQRIGEMVEKALQMLLARIENPEKEFEFSRFPSQLVVRGSTGHHPLQGNSSTD